MMVEEAMLIVEEDDLHTLHLLLFDKGRIILILLVTKQTRPLIWTPPTLTAFNGPIYQFLRRTKLTLPYEVVCYSD